MTNYINDLKRMMERSSRLFEPYIQYIRFPHYKNLLEYSRIDFYFPLTVLVGPNGCNKSSILQALYGCPRNNSTGQYWFSTDVDTIEEKKYKQCHIHGYWLESQQDYIEVLKTRINAKNEPDLWESSRPIIRYGMKLMPDFSENQLKERTKTRWKAIDKDVVYLDFRSEMGAYDQYFWFGNHHKTKTMNTKQDRIRRQSKHLRNVIDNKKGSYFLSKKEKVHQYYELSEKECSCVSAILGKNYNSIKIIEHSFYGDQFAKTVILQNSDFEYSEAFAGSGETSVVILVNRVMSAKDKSLILLDEPETSLHPKAQENLQKFLLQQIVAKKHQIVMATHSPSLIKNLPPEAIKVLLADEKTHKIKVIGKSFPEEAFQVIGLTDSNKLNIFVEDKLSKAIIEVFINKFRNYLSDSITVEYLAGGADSIIKNFVSSSAQRKAKHEIFIIDGDKMMDNRKPFDGDIRDKIVKYSTKGIINESRIPESENRLLGHIIKELTGCKIPFYIDGNEDGGNKAQLYEQQRNFINYWSNNVFFLPGLQPEELLYNSLKEDKQDYFFGEHFNPNGVDWKDFFVQQTLEDIAESRVNSDNILNYQRRIIARFPEDCEVFNKLDSIIETYFSS